MARQFPRIQAKPSEIEEFWNTRTHDMELIRDVRVDQFIGAQGESSIRLGSHLVSLAFTSADVTKRIDGGPPLDLRWPAGSLGFVPAWQHHWTLIKRPTNVTIVRLDDRFFRNVIADPVKMPLRNIEALDDPVAAHMVRALLHLAMRNRPQEWPILLEWLGTAIAARFMYQIELKGTGVKPPPDPRLSSERLRRAKDYIEAYLDQPLHLAQIAQAAAMSPYHFSRQFRKATGVTPVRYVWCRRVERAKLMLRNKTLSIAEIAFACGFSSQSHFTTLFRRMTGATPAEYRHPLFSAGAERKPRP